MPFTGKASFLLFRNDALKLAHLLAEAEQNNAILRLDDGLAGRDERLAAPDDPEQKYPLGQAKLMHTLPGDKGFLIHQSLEHFSGVAAHGDAGKHLPLPDILQNTVHGGQAGAHAVRDADGFHEGEVGGLVHAGHGFLHAEGFRQQAGQDVRFLVARHRDEGVHLINMLFLQEGLVRAVAVQDQRTLQLVRQLFAALLADVDELGVHALVLKEPRQTQADVPAAHDAGRAEVLCSSRSSARWLVGL